jgi:hypothetical protein
MSAPTPNPNQSPNAATKVATSVATKRTFISPTVEVAIVFAVSGLLVAVFWIGLTTIDVLQGPALLFLLGPLLGCAIALARWVEKPRFHSDAEQSRILLAYGILAATWPLVLIATAAFWFIATRLFGPLSTILATTGMLLGALLAAILLTLALFLMTTSWNWKTFTYLLIVAALGTIAIESLSAKLPHTSDALFEWLRPFIAFNTVAFSALYGVGLLRAQPAAQPNNPEQIIASP